jgi:asparagine synthase (glutamine-hydrolysing)
VDGPLHKLLARLLTKENIDHLGFVDLEKTSTLLDDAFVKKNPLAMRFALVVAQWVVLSQRFGIKKAEHPS